MGVRSTLQLPKEHGSWGMFYIPLVLGFLVARDFGVRGALFTGSASAMFLAREPFLAWWRSWRRGREARNLRPLLAIYSLAAASGGAALVLAFERPWLIPAGIAGFGVLLWHAERTMEGKGRSVAAELLSIAASTVAAPAAWYAETGRVDRTALLLWALSTAYFASSVFYVKMRVADAHARDASTPRRFRLHCAIYHAGLLAVLLWAISAEHLPVLAAAGFAAILIRALARVLRPTRQLNLKQIGWTEVVYSLVFLAVAALALTPSSSVQ